MSTAGKLALGAALVGLVAGAEWAWAISEWVRPAALEALLERAGPLAPLVFMAIMATAIVVSPIPTLPLDVVAGTAFGPWLGTLYAAVGALIGADIAFLMARWLGRDLVESKLGGHISFCEECSDHLLARLIFASRLVPVVSFDVVSYGAGLTKMSLTAFSLATFFGMLPLTFVYVAFGASLLESDPWILAGGVTVIALLFVLPWWIEGRNLFGLRDRFRHPTKEPQVAVRVDDSGQGA